MKKIQKMAAFLLALVLLLACAVQSALAAETVEVEVQAEFQYGEARKMLNLVNKFRTGKKAWYLAEDNKSKVKVKGLKELTYDYDLERTAMQRAVEIAAYFSHTRPDGSAWSSAYPSGSKTRGENIAYGFGSAKEAFNAFAEEDKDYAGQGHRRNMLRKEFTKVGFGCVKVGRVVYWAQAFGAGGGSSKEVKKYNSNKISAAEKMLLKTSRKIGAAEEELTIQVGATVSAPDAVIISNTGARLILGGRKWSSGSGIVSVSGGKLTANAEGRTTLTADVCGKDVDLPVSVVAGADAVGGDLVEIDDYEPALASDQVIVLEEDECFELE